MGTRGSGCAALSLGEDDMSRARISRGVARVAGGLFMQSPFRLRGSQPIGQGTRRTVRQKCLQHIGLRSDARSGTFEIARRKVTA